MIKIGLTGGIGSGKSTISNFLKKIDVKVVDADIIAREVLSIYPDILESIRVKFGDEVFGENGELNRRKLGGMIFSDENKKRELEDIIIPKIILEIRNRMDSFSDEEFVIVDAPTLMENEIHNEMDYNIVVWVDRKTQIQRVMSRDDLNEEEISQRIDSQMSLEDKVKLADFVVDNGNSIEDTERQVRSILKEIRMEREMGEIS